MTQDQIEELAHRRCKRYIHIDTEAPYQFDGHTLMDFVRDVQVHATRSHQKNGPISAMPLVTRLKNAGRVND
jgi:hypothetical protein